MYTSRKMKFCRLIWVNPNDFINFVHFCIERNLNNSEFDPNQSRYQPTTHTHRKTANVWCIREKNYPTVKPRIYTSTNTYTCIFYKLFQWIPIAKCRKASTSDRLKQPPIFAQFSLGRSCPIPNSNPFVFVYRKREDECCVQYLIVIKLRFLFAVAGSRRICRSAQIQARTCQYLFLREWNLVSNSAHIHLKLNLLFYKKSG